MTNDYTNIQHKTTNYVDDSTNIISTDDYNLLQHYINDFYKLLETYYDINKLKINADKSKILIICKQIFRQHTDTIQLTASEYTIEQSDHIKILGIIYTKVFDNTKQLNTIISKVNLRHNIIANILKISPIKSKMIIATSLCISIIRYGAGRMTSLNDNQITRINSLMLKISRYILGIKSFRMSTSEIFRTLGWHSYPQIIQYDSVRLIYMINNLSKPRALVNLFRFNMGDDNIRSVRTPSLIYKPKLVKTQKLQLYRGTYYFSKMTYDIRTAPVISFKNRLKKYISSHVSVYRADRPIT